MGKIKIIAALLLSMFIYSSCCFQKCAESSPFFSFKIVSATTGQDLLFGPNKIYDIDSIKVFSLSGADTVFYYTYKTQSLTGDSLLGIILNKPQYPVSFLRLNDTDTDTLQTSYTAEETRCCGKIILIDAVSYNNKPLEYNAEKIRVVNK